MQAGPINQQQLQIILNWIDSISLSRLKRNLTRDFSDGVLMAQILKSYFPNLIQLHNYSATNSSSSKYINWKTLNQKCLKKINLIINKSDIENIINCYPGTIEKVLFMVYNHLTQITQNNTKNSLNFNNNNISNNINNNINNKDDKKTINNIFLSNKNYFNSINSFESRQEYLRSEDKLNQKNTLGYFKELSMKLVEKDQIIEDLRDTILVLQQKLKKMEQLNQLKDQKIQNLIKKFQTDIDL